MCFSYFHQKLVLKIQILAEILKNSTLIVTCKIIFQTVCHDSGSKLYILLRVVNQLLSRSFSWQLRLGLSLVVNKTRGCTFIKKKHCNSLLLHWNIMPLDYKENWQPNLLTHLNSLTLLVHHYSTLEKVKTYWLINLWNKIITLRESIVRLSKFTDCKTVVAVPATRLKLMIY